MRICYFQKLFLFICLFFILPSAGKDIFVEFAQALEVAAEPISKIKFDLSQKELASQLDLKKDWNLEKKLSDKDYKNIITSWQESKDKNKLETVWDNQRAKEPQSDLKKPEIKTKLESTLHKIRNVTENEAFKDVKPPTKEPEHKRNIANYTIALNQAYKNFDNATNDDLRKINYFINQADNILQYAKQSETYEKLKKQHEKTIEEEKETEPQKTIEKDEYDSLKKELLNIKQTKALTITITEKLESIQAKLYYESGIPYMKPDLQVTRAQNWFAEITKRDFKAWQPSQAGVSNIWQSWQTGILQTLVDIMSNISKKLVSLKKNTDIITSLEHVKNKDKKEEESLKTAFESIKATDFSYLYGLGIPRLGQILSARSNALSENKKSFSEYQSNCKTELLNLLKATSSRFNKPRLNGLLICEFLEPHPLTQMIDLGVEMSKFKSIDKEFVDDLEKDKKILIAVKNAENEWKKKQKEETEIKKEETAPIPLSVKLDEVAKKRNTNWYAVYDFLKAQEKALLKDYKLIFTIQDEQIENFLKSLDNTSRSDNKLWNIDEEQRKVLVKMLQSPKPVGNNDIKEDWKNELDFLPFIFIAACLDPTLIDTKIAAMLDRLFALKKNDITDYSTKRLRYLLAMNDPKEKDKSKKNPFLEPELEYFFDLMREEKLSKNQIKDLLTK